jgi:hypothetical protein
MHAAQAQKSRTARARAFGLAAAFAQAIPEIDERSPQPAFAFFRIAFTSRLPRFAAARMSRFFRTLLAYKLLHPSRLSRICAFSRPAGTNRACSEGGDHEAVPKHASDRHPRA